MEIYLQSAWQMYFCGQKKSGLNYVAGDDKKRASLS